MDQWVLHCPHWSRLLSQVIDSSCLVPTSFPSRSSSQISPGETVLLDYALTPLCLTGITITCSLTTCPRLSVRWWIAPQTVTISWWISWSRLWRTCRPLKWHRGSSTKRCPLCRWEQSRLRCLKVLSLHVTVMRVLVFIIGLQDGPLGEPRALYPEARVC